MTSGAALFAGAAAGAEDKPQESAKTAPPAKSNTPAHILVPQTKVEVMAEADVLVCGGGPAGVAAACAAARGGAKTVLIERWPFVGGMGTAALVNIWHLSDRKKIIIRGLVEEAVQRAERRGWIRFRGHQGHHETHDFDPEGMKIVLHEMLEAS